MIRCVDSHLAISCYVCFNPELAMKIDDLITQLFHTEPLVYGRNMLF